MQQLSSPVQRAVVSRSSPNVARLIGGFTAVKMRLSDNSLL